MDITIHASFLPHNDPDAALAFYRDILGFELRKDVGYNGMRWLTVGPVDQPGTSIVLHPPAVDPGISDAEIVQEPTDQPYGVRDCAVRDPAGNLLRIQEIPS
jgi:catechol 2,3-dioxygenase-like lactoylglutathione lyase family enzyme